MSNLPTFLTNICYDFFFNWQTEKKTVLDQQEIWLFSTAQTEKNTWTKFGKQIGENI